MDGVTKYKNKMAKTKTGTKKETKFELPDYDDLKKGEDGYKATATVFDSEFKTFEKIDEEFIGKYMETLTAGKKGEEKPCALFIEKETGKKFLLGSYKIMEAVAKYGQREYKIIYKGKVKTKQGFKANNFEVKVK